MPDLLSSRSPRSTLLLGLRLSLTAAALLGCVFGCQHKDDAQIQYLESEKGDPATIGCSDGQREAFADIQKNPDIAGCVGTWQGARSLRDEPTGRACGDDLGECTVPGDVCAQGWHVCGVSGKNDDLRGRIDPSACDTAGPGRFNAGMSHGQNDRICPPIPTKETVFPCREAGNGSEPVCCGNNCSFGKCSDGVWPGRTRISMGVQEGCGSVGSERNGGVLCCRGAVPEGPPLDVSDAPAAAAAAAAKADMPQYTADQVFGRRIAEYRREKGLTQEELAKQADLPVEVLDKLEQGDALPSLETLQRIAAVFGLPLVDLFKPRRERSDVDVALDGLTHDLEQRSAQDIDMIRDVAHAIFAERSRRGPAP